MEATTDIRDLLRRNQLFEEFSDEELDRILSFAQEKKLDGGTFIINQGDVGNEVYVIHQGLVEVIRKSANRGRWIQITTLQDGDAFGEMSLIDNGYRSASVRTLKPTTVIFFSIAEIHALPQDQEIISRMYKGLAQQLNRRLRFTNEAMVAALGKEEEHARARFLIGMLLFFSTLVLCLFAFEIGRISTHVTRTGASPPSTQPQIIIQ